MTLSHQERGRLGGLTAAKNLGPEGRKRRAMNGGQAALDRHGPALFVRLNYIQAGKLPRGPVVKREVRIAGDFNAIT